MSGPTGTDALSLSAELASGAPPRVVDVRTPAEFETAHIPGALNVPLDTLRLHRDRLVVHLDEHVVLVCRTGHRAHQAEAVLAEAGLPGVAVLDGGMASWESTGQPVSRGRETWDIERQVRLVAGTIVLLGVVGSTILPGLQWLAAVMGLGLAVAALTNTCLMGVLLARLPYNRGASSDLESILLQFGAAEPA